jgi:hypothetical protein
MRKYLVVLLASGLLACLAVVAGIVVTALTTHNSVERAASEEAWSLGPVAVRGEEEYRRAADGFRQRYRWLVPEEATPQEQDVPAAAVVEAPEPVASGPAWQFVGVLLEAGSARLALVSEGGEVRRYQEGEMLGDGTQLLAIGEQSLRISQAGNERDVYLYRPDE